MQSNEGIRLVRIEGENVRKLTAIAVRLDGEPGLYRVTSGGENGEGKTTLLDVVSMLFGGADAVKADTIQEGKDGAWVRGTLSNGYTIERRFTAAAPAGYLDVTTPDNARPKKPQTLLSGWAGPHSWDPGALLRKKPSELASLVLSLASRPGLEAQLRSLAQERATVEEQRKDLNRQVQLAQRTPIPEGERPMPVDTSAEMERLARLEDDAKLRSAELYAWERAEDRLEAASADVATQEKTVHGLADRLAKARQDLSVIRATVEAAGADVEQARARYEALPDPSGPMEEVRIRIRSANQVQTALARWTEYDRIQFDAESAKAEAAELTRSLKAIDHERERQMLEAGIPVPGATFSAAGELLLHGRPFEVASGREKLDFAVDVAFAANPAVKVVLLDEANDYSLAALEGLDERARERGWQVIACRLGLEGPGEIVVTGGVAATHEPDEAPEGTFDNPPPSGMPGLLGLGDDPSPSEYQRLADFDGKELGASDA